MILYLIARVKRKAYWDTETTLPVASRRLEEEIAKALKNHSSVTYKKTLPIQELKSVQSKIEDKKVELLRQVTKFHNLPEIVKYKDDYYVWDGLHRIESLVRNHVDNVRAMVTEIHPLQIRINASLKVPDVVYHGTTKELETFRTPAMFHRDINYCRDLIKDQPNGRIISARLSVENPADLRALHISPSDPNFINLVAGLKAEGYDSAQYREEAWIAFYPEQIHPLQTRNASLRTAKFKNEHSMRCAHCYGYLLPDEKPVINTNHQYPYGILYVCRCGMSQVWCNSLRAPWHFVKWLNGTEPRYTSGFCNDAYCGFCHEYHRPIVNGYSDYSDLFGCENPGCSSMLTDIDPVYGKAFDQLMEREYYQKKFRNGVMLVLGNAVISDGRKSYQEDSTPPALVEYFKKAIEKFGPECVGEKNETIS
jgi:hypothetical protein